MKIAIVYCSRHGGTDKIVSLIAQKLEENDVQSFNLLKCSPPSIKDFDTLIIGGPIYFGMIQTPLKQFCALNQKALVKKQYALFVSSILEGEELNQFEEAFSLTLLIHSKANACLGGELRYDKLSFFEKLIFRNIQNARQGIYNINYAAIDQFVYSIKFGTPNPRRCIM